MLRRGQIAGNRARTIADVEAQAAMARGQILGGTVAGIAGSVGDLISGYARDKAEAPARALEHATKVADLRLKETQIAEAGQKADERAKMTRQDTAFAGLFEMYPDGNIPPKELSAIYGPQKGLTIANALTEWQNLRAGKVADLKKTAVSIGAGLKALKSPALQAAFWPQVKQAAVDAQIPGADQFPDAYSPEVADFIIAFGKGELPETPEPFTLNPGDVRFGPDGEEIARVPAPVKEPETYTLGPGQVRYGADGQVVARGPAQQQPATEPGWKIQTVTNPTTNQTGMVRVNERTGEVQPVELPEGMQPGGQRAPRLTAAQQEDLATMATVVDLTDLAEKLGEEIGWKGVGGMGSGSVARFTAKNFGMGTEKEENLRNYIGNIQGTIAKLRGGASFTVNEQKMLDSYTPTINDGDNVIKAKLKSLREFIALKKKNTMEFAGADAGAPKGGQEFDYDPATGQLVPRR